jgi:bacterioferritin-associated ferredoxin
MIVCHCVGATDTTIRKAIARGATSVADIARQTGAGRCCEPCRAEVAEILAAAREDSAAVASSPARQAA